MAKSKHSDAIPEKVVAEIAKNILHIDTLEEQKRDHLDFHELSVWTIKQALAAAYQAGRNAAK
jgi:hypothetical protein